MSFHSRLKTFGTIEQHRLEERAASRAGWRIKPGNNDPSIEHRPHYLEPSKASELPSSSGADRQSRSLSKTAIVRRRHPRIDHARRLLGPIETTNGPEAQTQVHRPRGRTILRSIVVSAVASALILVSGDLQKEPDNNSRIVVPGLHATRLTGGEVEAGSSVELRLGRLSNKGAITKIVDEAVTEHGAIVGLTNFDQLDFKSSDTDTEASPSPDEQTGLVSASFSPHEVASTVAHGGPKIELASIEPNMPKRSLAVPHFRVQIAAVRNETDAQRAWVRSLTSHGAILGDMEPYIVRAETSNGIFYRIQTGPFETRSEADQVCARLRERGAICIVVDV